MKNRLLAHSCPDIYMSLILDGMQQSHCNLPHRGNNKVYDKEVIQHIQGVRQHGQWDTFYRTFSHISGGGNLAIDVLLREIHLRLDNSIAEDKPFPPILLLQIDGGSENACVAFYALCCIIIIYTYKFTTSSEYYKLLQLCYICTSVVAQSDESDGAQKLPIVYASGNQYFNSIHDRYLFLVANLIFSNLFDESS
jgi:hypothetical protein